MAPAAPTGPRRPGRPTPTICATIERYLEGCASGPGAHRAGLEEAMRYSLLAGGKRIRPVLALATARAIGSDEADAAARRGARADPHLLADPRRPAGDGRRRPAARPADLPRGVRRGRRDPGRRRPLRGGLPARAGQPGGAARAHPGRRRASWRPPPASTAWSAASTSTSPRPRRPGRRAAAPARAQDRPADRRVGRVRTASGGHR